MAAVATARANPYVGPRAFETGETLFGREQETLELLDLLIAERILLLYSPSGAGKTSLVQAALIPRLKARRFRVLPVIRLNHEPPIPVDYEGEASNRYALSALLSLGSVRPGGEQLPPATLARMGLDEYLDRLPRRADEPEEVVLIFDQFEEILTADPTDVKAKERFFSWLGAGLGEPARFALFAMREDYVAALDPYRRRIPTRLRTTYRLALLGESAAREAIQGPARAAGVEFTDAAARMLIDDLRRVRVQRP